MPRSSIQTRMYRLGLPSAKRYIIGALAVRCAALGEHRRLSLTAIVTILDAGTTQALSRTFRIYRGELLSQFVARHDGASALAEFRDTLITPYLRILRTRSILPDHVAHRLAEPYAPNGEATP